MRKRLKLLMVTVFILTSASMAFARGNDNIARRGLFSYLAPPRLIYPILDTVDLGGKDFLEFQWGNNDIVGIDHYDFRLYKAYNTYAANLILKQQLSADSGSIKVEAKTFEAGQVYTWVLKQITLGGNKSDPSSNSFKVIKK